MRRFVVISALCLVFSCGFVKPPQRVAVSEPAQSATPRTLHLYTEGLKRRIIDGDTAAARHLLLEAVAVDTAYAPACYEIAKITMFSATDEATEYARRAADIDSTNKWYLELYGRILVVGRRYGEAIPVYEKLVRLHRNPENYRVLAILYEQNERPFSAISILDTAETRFGTIPELNDIKRRLLLSTRQYDRALEEARKMVDAVPYEPENHVALGEVYDIRGEDSLTRASFLRAVETDSTSVAAWAALGDYYNSRNDHRAHIEVIQRLFGLDELPLKEKVKIFGQLTSNIRFYREFYPQINRLAATLFIKYPDRTEAVRLYAEHLIRSGEIEEALKIYKRHTDDEPPAADYFTAVMEIESYLKRPDSVMLYLEKALARFPDDPQMHLRRGHMLAVEGRDAEALRSYRTSLKAAANDTLRSDIWGYIGDLYHQMSDKARTAADSTAHRYGMRSNSSTARNAMKRCYDAYDKALAAFADNASVLNNYAYFLTLEERDLERALEMSSRAIKLSENNPTFLDTYAWALYRSGRYDEAKRFMRQAISLDRTNSPELQMHYGDILAALGEKYMAEVYWRRARDNGYDPQAVEERMKRLNPTPPER